ncbi:probable prolyl 4-hydroxylase 9 [Zingiber officinale]|uniref:procollagen-proline 4-dioxygenase n=1 Tax=Zingiber officinale TaxID=94328 RepID=A0A8J5GWG8_ZINOF|nr:probable prolyl 4-hydroxylase 9 [Zingiber officinale]KAG6507688.1 hypothetical protein ZIOFF_033039 [Zingiber officinale]
MGVRRLRKESMVERRLLLWCCFLCFVSGFFTSRLFLQEGSSSAGGGPPTVLHGRTGESKTASIPYQVLSWKPRAVYFPGFATKEQCEIITETARARLEPSKLMLREGETPENTKGIRTSTGTFLRASEDSTGTLEEIEQKIARVSLIPRENGEPFNVLRYEIGQKYASHYDAFDPAEYGPQTSSRVATFLLYLSDVEEGGETAFPFENGSNMDIGYDYEECIGLKIKPNRGDGILFFSMFLNQTIDPTSLHGSCPVKKGEKWVVTKWMRDQRQV